MSLLCLFSPISPPSEFVIPILLDNATLTNPHVIFYEPSLLIVQEACTKWHAPNVGALLLTHAVKYVNSSGFIVCAMLNNVASAY